MFLDPVKLAGSFLIAALIMSLGIFALGTNNPSLAIARLLPPLAISETFDTASQAQTVATDSTNSNQIEAEISPENAIMETEAMMASVDTNYPVNNNDW